MLHRRSLFGATAAAFILMLVPGKAQEADILTIMLKDGPVKVQLRPDLAPKHVERIKQLASEGAYNGVVFHRVIDGFMAQTGDVQYGNTLKDFDLGRAGTGGSALPDLPAEFTDKAGFERGTVGMARAQNPDSANSQFFIMFAPGDFLNGQYTIVGNVIEGMELVDNIKKGDQAQNGAVSDPDIMVSVTVSGAN